jgi:hypothetical protein
MSNTNLIEAAKQALNALSMPCDRWNKTQHVIVEKAITALQTAIDEVEKQEPLAWMPKSRFEQLLEGLPVVTTLTAHIAFEDDVAIYTTPPTEHTKGINMDENQNHFPDFRPNYSISFCDNEVGGGKEIGKLDFNGPSLVFTGDAEESAKVFIAYVARVFEARLEEERKVSQRQWVGLTDEDIEQEFGFINEMLRDLVHRTEAKVKEKNT